MSKESRRLRPLRCYGFLPIDMLKIKWLRHKSSSLRLSDWENKFLKDVKRKTKLTIKQKLKIEQLYNKYRLNWYKKKNNI